MNTSFVKTAFLLAGVLLSTVLLAQQSTPGTPEERASRQTARMKERLHLSAEQETSVAEINLNYARKNQSLLETGGRNLHTARKVQDQLKRKDEELKNVLDASQFRQYLALKDELKSELRNRRKQR